MSRECVDAVQELYSALVSHYSPAMAKLVHADTNKGMDDLLLQSFAGCLVLKRWLGNDGKCSVISTIYIVQSIFRSHRELRCAAVSQDSLSG